MKSGNAEVSWILNNYFSVGVDAEIVLNFHSMRESHHSLFQGVMLNKGWYAAFSAKAIIRNDGSLATQVTLHIDGKEIPIPKKIKGLVVMNVRTYGGAKCWRQKDKKQKSPTNSASLQAITEGSDQPMPEFSPPALDDGKLEVVGIKGVTHLGAIQTGLTSAKKLGQGRRVGLTLHSSLASQVDGEPCQLHPCFISFTYHNKALLLKRNK
jgi:diacylglycerol kinase (ATP)